MMAFQNAKRRSRKKANGGRGFTRVQWKELVRRAGGVCVYCRKNPISSIDHFKPLALGGPDDYENIVPACGVCNSLKRESEPWQWVRANYPNSEAHIRSVMTWFTPQQIQSGACVPVLRTALVRYWPDGSVIE